MTRRHLLLCGLLAVATGCSNRFQAYSDFDPGMNILGYKTYSWPAKAEIESRNNPLLFNELTYKRIREAVDQQLVKNGYHHTDTAAQLLVHYHVVFRDKVIDEESRWPDTYGPYWQERKKRTIRYKEGTLIIDLMDATNCNLIWRGWATEVFEEYTNTLTEEEIVEAVTRIFANYPKRP